MKPPSKMSPGIEGFYPSGSLTHGLSMASGIGISDRVDGDKKDSEPIFCVLGDTELQGGQIWETAVQISFHKLTNIIAFVDDNGMGNDYETAKTLDIGDIESRFSSCGWQVAVVKNGHDVNDLMSAINNKNKNLPLVVIAKTIKGKGISFMENDNIWHGLGPNDEQFIEAYEELDAEKHIIDEIIELKKNRIASLPLQVFPREKTLRDSAADALLERMKVDERIVVIAPELAESTRAGKLSRAFPKRVFNLGVQEPNAMDIVAGLAFSGKIPVIITFTNFVLLRTVDQIFQNIAPFCENALIVGTHDGFMEDGMSVTPYNHFAISRSFYKSKVFCPADYYESKNLTNVALDNGGYSFIFNSRENMPVIYDENIVPRIGIAKIFNPSKNFWSCRIENNDWSENIGGDMNIMVAGAPFVWIAKEVAKELYVKNNISISVINFSSLKPIDEEVIKKGLKKTRYNLVIEKHSPYGGLFSIISEVSVSQASTLKFNLLQYMKNEWVGQSGTPDQLLTEYGFDKDSIKKFILNIMKK